MTMQASFSELEYVTEKKVTRRDRFFDKINNVCYSPKPRCLIGMSGFARL